MYLLEHDAKELLSAHGIPSPAGILLEDADALQPAALPGGPWVVKGQIPAGGRGKAGIILRATTPAEARSHAASIIASTTGRRPVNGVRIEKAVTGAQEAYLSLLLDSATAQVHVIVSARGGMDIEQIARESLHADSAPANAVALAACLRRLAAALPDRLRAAVSTAGERAAQAFIALEALLLEINPLFVLAEGDWLAGDAKLVTDDNALARQPRLRALLERRAHAYPEAALKLHHGFDYVVVDAAGEIGLLTTGAGLSMMLIDELREAGLKPYNFLDIRTGGLRGETARLVQVLNWIAEGRNIRVLLVNIFAGITDLGEFSRLLVTALSEAPRLKVPVVARLVGNGLPAARQILAASGIPLHTDLDAALAEVREHLSRG